MSGKSITVGRMRFLADIISDFEHSYTWAGSLPTLLKEVALHRVKYGDADEIYHIYVTTEPEIQYLDHSSLYVFTNPYGNSKVAMGSSLRSSLGEHTLKVRRAFELPIMIGGDYLTLEEDEYFICCAYKALDSGKDVFLSDYNKHCIDEIQFDDEHKIYKFGLEWKNKVYDEVYLEDALTEGADSESISTLVGDIL